MSNRRHSRPTPRIAAVYALATSRTALMRALAEVSSLLVKNDNGAAR